MIRELLQNKSAREKANVKGQEIAKIKNVVRTNVKFSGADYDIEIVKTKPIEGGVEVFAKAWNPGGTQIGFGRDGSIDIEKFVIINPPILVSDPNGTIEVEFKDPDGNILSPKKYREDAQQAILRSLAHTISVKKEKFGNERIIKDKIGNTTTTVYPDADPESTSVDGHAAKDGGSNTFADLRAGTGTGANDTNTSNFARIQSFSSTDTYESMYVGFALFDTSSIPDTDTISSAVASFKGDSVADNLAQDAVLTNSNPDSNTAIAAADYTDHVTQMATELGTARIDLGAWNTADYNNFTITNPNTNVSKTGITKLGLRVSSDFDNSAPTWSASVSGLFQWQSAEAAGTDSDPKLVVEHTSPVDAGFLMFMGPQPQQ